MTTPTTTTDLRPLRLVQYPHPALRHVSKPLVRVDDELRGAVREMFEIMYENKGVGLAANQVDLPYRLFIVNLKGDPKAADEERVYINPVISRPKGTADAEEGCLSLPGLYADVKRPEKVVLYAYNLAGEEIEEELDDLHARVVQHEVDHLNGVLFIDRLSPTAVIELKERLEEFEIQYEGQLRRGEIDEEQMIARLAELERLRT